MKLETKLQELEKIVARLEAGECDLEESISLFEEGIKLSRSCQKILDDAENKVSLLISDTEGNMTKTNFTESESN